uniref:Uncharacterized protein n=1 Tax=Romanomermis culicivorax TaxID=13658 RepID=A0A915I1D0_ROMCU
HDYDTVRHARSCSSRRSCRSLNSAKFTDHNSDTGYSATGLYRVFRNFSITGIEKLFLASHLKHIVQQQSKLDQRKFIKTSSHIPSSNVLGAPAVPGVPSFGHSESSTLSTGPASGTLGGLGSPEAAMGAIGRSASHTGDGSGGSNLNASPVQLGGSMDVKSEKNGEDLAT